MFNKLNAHEGDTLRVYLPHSDTVWYQSRHTIPV